MDTTKDKELVRAYKEEAYELLGIMRESVLTLSPRGEGVRSTCFAREGDRRAVYRLFRACHTLKEISGGIGFNDIEKMADQLLEVSRAIKDGKEGLDNNISLVYEKIKACRGLLNEKKRNNRRDK